MHPDSTRLLKPPSLRFSLPHPPSSPAWSQPSQQTSSRSNCTPPPPTPPLLPKHPSLSLSLCSRYTTLAWDGMRKHRPKIPLDPETSSCSWIYHTNKERRGKKKTSPPPLHTPKQKIPSKNMLSCFKMQSYIQTGPFSSSLPFFFFLLLHFNSSNYIDRETH